MLSCASLLTITNNLSKRIIVKVSKIKTSSNEKRKNFRIQFVKHS